MVHQAIGVLVAQFGLKPDDALAKLRTLADDRYRSVTQVAREIVENQGL